MRIGAVAGILVVVGIGALLAGCGKGTPPTISAPPKAETVCAGGSVTFSVTATGRAPLSYQWRKDGVAIPGATGATYTISPVSSAHAGSYSVVVSNAVGSVTSAAAVLTVNVPPSITAQPAGQVVCTGKTVLFTVTASGTAPLSYQWQKDGAPIPGATTAIYTIPAVTSADGGTYTVVVTNACGSVTSAPATLAVDVPPAIVVQPSAQTVCAGHPAVFAVTATGSPPLAYQWEKDGTPIAGATTASYAIPAAGSADAGTYRVTVANACGTVSSAGATLTVNTPPAITLHPLPQTVAAGSSVTLSVIATGTSPLAYQWRKDGEEIPGATSDLYSIGAVSAAHGGTYTVVVTNPCGSVTSTPALLTVTPAPVAPALPPTAPAPFITVDGHPLAREAFDRIRTSILNYYTRLYAQFGIDIRAFLVGARGRLFDLELDLTALTGLITHGLVEAEGKRRGVSVTDEEIDAEFRRQYQAMLDAHGITEEYLSQYFAARGRSLEEFKAEGRANVAEQLLYRAVQEAVVGPIELSQDELRQYFAAHKADYSTEEQVEASHILVKTEEEAQAILAELAAGADFAELARTRSADPGSAPHGGQLGWFGRGAMVPEFEEAAFALQVGETSGIVQTQYGFHIIRVTNRREASEPEFEAVAERVRRDATDRISREKFDAWLKGARRKATVVISDPILHAMYLKDLDLDRGIAAFEKIQAEGKVEEKYLSFIIGSLYEEKMAALQSDLDAQAQLPEGPDRDAKVAALKTAIDAAREAALAAYRQALQVLPDDEGVKERIAALEGAGAVPR